MSKLRAALRQVSAVRSDVTSADLFRQDQTVLGWTDDISGTTVTGWALDRDPSNPTLTIELRHRGKTLARCHTEENREDIAEILGRPLRAGFRLDLRSIARDHGDVLSELVDEPLELRLVGSEKLLGPGPIQLSRAQVGLLRQHREGRLAGLKNTREFVSQRVRHVNDSAPALDVRALAFFLPQFHATAANDTWWGEGFTEWSNVSQARRFFEGHTQPRVPTTMGYYDLTAPRTLARQAELAKEYGIHGFCFYSYSFEGEGLLADPVEILLSRPDIDLPFALCWANENWTRRWDGDNAEVLISQTHDIEQDRRYLDGLLETFKDPRYITVNGAPVLLVYRPGLMSDPWAVTEGWRDAARAAGFPDLYLVMAQTFGALDPRPLGFDAAVEFPPHNFPAPEITQEVDTIPEFRGRVYDYRSLVADSMARTAPEYPLHKTIMPSWDNSPRKDAEGHIFHGSTPALFQAWVAHTASVTKDQFSQDSNFMFINAWNEWAEGAHLEPDSVHGTTYLEATRAGLAGRTGPREALEQLRRGDLDARRAGELADEVTRQLDALEQGNTALGDFVRTRAQSKHVTRLRSGYPGGTTSKTERRPGAQAWLDHFGGYPNVDGSTVSQGARLLVSGWSVCPGLSQSASTMSFLALDEVDGTGHYAAYVHGRRNRDDVISALSASMSHAEAAFSGFSVTLDFSAVSPGDYNVSIVYLVDKHTVVGSLEGVLRVC